MNSQNLDENPTGASLPRLTLAAPGLGNCIHVAKTTEVDQYFAGDPIRYPKQTGD